MKKIKFSVGVLAFMGLAAINFTQSESCFVSKALASSSNNSSVSGGSGNFDDLWSSVESWWDSKTWECAPYTCKRETKIDVVVGGMTVTTEREGTECRKGNVLAHCLPTSLGTCNPCD